MRLNILLVFCCVIAATSAVKSIERTGDTSVSTVLHNRVKRQDPFTIAGTIVSIIGVIISLVTSTVGLTQPSSTDVRLDTVIAQLDKIESHLAKLDSTLLDVFDVKDVKDARNKITSMKDKRMMYLKLPNSTFALNDYINSCDINDPKGIVSLLYDAQCGDKLFGAKKLSDYCIMYRSKDLYLYGVSPYKTAQRLVLYAQEAFLNAVLCMNAKGQVSDLSYFVTSFNWMIMDVWKLNQSLDADLRMEETRVKYAIKAEKCVGARTDSVQSRHYTSYTDCTQNLFHDEQLWKFDFVERVLAGAPIVPNGPFQYKTPVYCNESNELKYQPPDYLFRAFDVHDIPRFATGYAQFDNNAMFQLRNVYRDEVMFAINSETQWAIPDGNQPPYFGDFGCVRDCSLLKDRRAYFIPYSFYFIQRNPPDGMGATTFTIKNIFGGQLTWRGGYCYCSYFNSTSSMITGTNLWSIVGVDSAGKATPLA